MPGVAAINVRALERQITLLQEVEANTIRTSHDPPAPELLDLCDRTGMFVMREEAKPRMVISLL